MAEFQNFFCFCSFLKSLHRIYKFSSQSHALLYYKALLTRSLNLKRLVERICHNVCVDLNYGAAWFDGMGWNRISWGGWDGMGWGGMGRDGTEWDAMGWGRVGWAGMGWDWLGWDGIRRGGMGWSGWMGWDGICHNVCVDLNYGAAEFLSCQISK